MNIDSANIEPYRRYHDFHENINITIKVISASVFNLINHLSASDEKELGRLIEQTDKSWTLPPIWSLEGKISEEYFGIVSDLGILSIFSALDDFINGVEAEISRWNANPYCKKQLLIVDKYEIQDEKIRNLFSKYGWDIGEIEEESRIIKYFQLCRNCMAHRSSKASEALMEFSLSEELKDSFEKFKNETINLLPTFEVGQKIFIDPKTAIFCSHLVREATKIVNQKVISYLGIEGIVNMAVFHFIFKDVPVNITACKTPEAVINLILSERYRVYLENGTEAIQILKSIDKWIPCIKMFQKKYGK